MITLRLVACVTFYLFMPSTYGVGHFKEVVSSTCVHTLHLLGAFEVKQGNWYVLNQGIWDNVTVPPPDGCTDADIKHGDGATGVVWYNDQEWLYTRGKKSDNWDSMKGGDCVREVCGGKLR
mgnify:CR=1 FL=1